MAAVVERRTFPAAFVCLLALGGCGEPEPARFVALEIWEGRLTSRNVVILDRLVEPDADGGFTLRRDTHHVARVSFSTAGRTDRCLFRPFHYSWDHPSASYICYPEPEGGAMTLELPFATSANMVARARDLYIGVQA